jgi:hypothetical protein
VESTWFPVNVNADETLLDESIDISLLVWFRDFASNASSWRGIEPWRFE